VAHKEVVAFVISSECYIVKVALQHNVYYLISCSVALRFNWL